MRMNRVEFPTVKREESLLITLNLIDQVFETMKVELVGDHI